MTNKLSFRPLKADEIEVRVGQIYDTEKFTGVSLLLYKNARVDMDILDETVGCENWQRSHYECKGNLFCTVSIWDDDKDRFIDKSDCGTESFTEREKGESSDSFKRACVNWGIGRELYTAPRIFVKDCNIDHNQKTGKPVCNDKFSVSEIEYKDKRIVRLVIFNAGKGFKRNVFCFGGDRQDYEIPQSAPKQDPILLCYDCGNPISVQEHDYSVKHYGTQLCRDCQQRYKR